MMVITKSGLQKLTEQEEQNESTQSSKLWHSN
jgi:hypothetical protein